MKFALSQTMCPDYKSFPISSQCTITLPRYGFARLLLASNGLNGDRAFMDILIDNCFAEKKLTKILYNFAGTQICIRLGNPSDCTTCSIHGLYIENPKCQVLSVQFINVPTCGHQQIHSKCCTQDMTELQTWATFSL